MNDTGACDRHSLKMIRSYTDSDRENTLRFFRKVFSGLGFAFDLDGKDADLSAISDRYQTRGGTFLLANRDDQIVGSIGLRRLDEECLELKRFYVAAEYRRNRIGTRLLQDAIAHASRGAARRIRLDTSRKSPAAISLFRKHGFVEIARYNDDPFAEVFMELSGYTQPHGRPIGY